MAYTTIPNSFRRDILACRRLIGCWSSLTSHITADGAGEKTMAYPPIPNPFRRDTLACRRLIGCWSSLTSHITAEILGQADFDWILLDSEHAPNDLSTLL